MRFKIIDIIIVLLIIFGISYFIIGVYNGYNNFDSNFLVQIFFGIINLSLAVNLINEDKIFKLESELKSMGVK